MISSKLFHQNKSDAERLGRELFPGSDCLKWTERKGLLLAELGCYAEADIICLQVCLVSSQRTPSLSSTLLQPVLFVQLCIFGFSRQCPASQGERLIKIFRNVTASPTFSQLCQTTERSMLKVEGNRTVWSPFTGLRGGGSERPRQYTWTRRRSRRVV